MNNFVDQLIEKADIVDIVGRFVKLHKSGANYFGLCPFHEDTHATNFCVSPKKKIFKCFACKVSGNVINFIQKYKKISYGEAIKEVAKLSGFSDQDINQYLAKQNKSYNPANMRLFDLNSDANELFKTLLYNDDNKQYLQYLYDRKLSDKTLKSFDIGFAGKGSAKRVIYDLLTNPNLPHKGTWNEDDLLKTSLINIKDKTSEISDYFHNRITFPIKDKNGFIVAFIARDIAKDTQLKYLTSRETILFSKSNTLYNFERVVLEKPNTLIVLEGNIDLMSLYEAGLDETKYGVVALMGTAFTQQHKNMIANTRSIENIVLWFDNDDAGKASTITNGLQLLSLRKNMIVVNNTTKYKDVNDILVNEGPKKVLETLESINNPRFVSYYIDKTLSGLSSLNVDSKVKDVLKVVKMENNPSHFDQYINHIAEITKLSPVDLRKTYELINVDRSFITPAARPQSKKIVYPPIVNTMINSFRQLIAMLLIDPSLAQRAYEELESKDPNKISVQEIKDYLYSIKALAITNFALTDLINQEEQLFAKLFETKKISEVAYKFIKDSFFEIQTNASYSIANRVSVSKVLASVEHINSCYDQILLSQYRYDLDNKKLSDEEKAVLRRHIDRLTEKVNEFKKHKKTKYHIA